MASTTLRSPEWNNTAVIEGDVAQSVARLKQENGNDILVNCRGVLVRSLLRDPLLDELRLFLQAIVVRSRVRLFQKGRAPVSLTLADSQAYANGASP